MAVIKKYNTDTSTWDPVVVGKQGPVGEGVPTGGTTGQFLRKSSATNYDTAWHTIVPSDIGAVASTGDNTVTGEQLIVGAAVDDIPLIVKGVSGQTANLFEVQTSSGGQRLRINDNGYITIDGNIQSLGLRLGTSVTFTTGQRWLSVQDAASIPSTVSSGVIIYSESGKLKVRDSAGSYEVSSAPVRATLNDQTGTTYTLALTDENKLVTFDNPAAITVTVPTNTSVAFPIGSKVDLAQTGAGQVTVAGDSGVTVQTAQTLLLRAQWSGASLVKIDTDEWLLVGDLEAA